MLTVRQLFDYETFTYTYLLSCKSAQQAVLIDPVNTQVKRDLQLLKDLKLTLTHVLDTHMHADHVTGAGDLRAATGARYGISAAAHVTCADLQLQEGDTIQIGAYLLTILTTPGHTNGCVTYYSAPYAFTGDTLFIRGCGRTDFQEGSATTLYESITQKLYTLPDDTVVYPGHNYNGLPYSTIAEEKQHNPRLFAGQTKEHFVETMNKLTLAPPKLLDKALPLNKKCGLTNI